MTTPARTATLRLRPDRHRSLLRRHPWVFSGAVDRVDGDPAPGANVLVKAHDGTELGWAAYSPESQIRARMWTFDPTERPDAALLDVRLRQGDTLEIARALRRRGVQWHCSQRAPASIR